MNKTVKYIVYAAWLTTLALPGALVGMLTGSPVLAAGVTVGVVAATSYLLEVGKHV